MSVDLESLQEELVRRLKEKGACEVGFADLHDHPEAKYPVGISAYIILPAEVVKPLQEAPTRIYYDTYNAVNETLAQIAATGESFLRENGFHALAHTEENYPTDAEDRCILPQKTVACCAGLGWIGKNNLLTTERYGGAVRLCSIMTDAPLTTSMPITESQCGNCRECVDHCPAQALYNTTWKAGIPREEIFNRPLCETVQKDRMEQYVGFRYAICGKCFAVCPHTRRYLDEVLASSK